MNTINLIWFYVDKYGCGTYRCYIPALALEESKRFASSFLWQEDLVNRQSYIEDLENVQIAIFQRPPTPIFGDIMKDCKERGIKVVVELDDHLFDVPRHNPSGWIWRKKPIQKMFKKYLEGSDLVTVSTIPLKWQVEDQGIPRDKIMVCHNHLHEVVWGSALANTEKYDNHNQVIIGWQGSTTHDVDFKEALPALKKVLEVYPQTKLRLFGDVPRSVKETIPYTRVEWTVGVPYELYPRKLSYCNFDIGIAPLTDSKFNQCKSNIKWMEYSALKIPCIASSVYPYTQSISNGYDGLIASNESDWFQALSFLIEQTEARKAIGENAFKKVWSQWSTDQHYVSWAKAFESLVPELISG